MAGLLNSTLGTAKPKNVLGQDMVEAETTIFDPEKRAIDPAKETVSGQLQGLLDSGSPYLERARGRAAEGMNARGLLNSSIALGAGEAAAIDAALPIATADANVYGTAARDNQASGNTALQAGASEANTASRFNAGEQNQVQRLKLASKLQSDLNTQQAAHTVSLQQLRGEQANLLQASQVAASTFSDIERQIAAALADTTTSAQAKAATVTELANLLRTGLSLIGGMHNIDVAGLLNFSLKD